jgi:Protein kinase domain
MLEPGVVVAGYRVETVIAEGETGVLYEATKLSSEEKVALKLVDAGLSADADFRERFQREGRIQTAIDHPNLIAVLAVGESEHGLFVATELIRGTSLKDLIAGEALEVDRTVRILGQVADALDTVHRAGLIHGDIRADRILLRAEEPDHAYLADFGVTEDRHRSGVTGGATTEYMAPERIRGEPSTTYTDIYGLGAVLYECLSGTVPFPGDSPAAVVNAHLTDPPPRLTERRPELPGEVDGVVSTAMAKNPTDRYATAAEMVQALGEAVTPEPVLDAPAPESASAPAAPTRGKVAREAPGRKRYAIWAAAGIAVLALAAGGFLAGRGSSSEKASSPTTILAGGVSFTVPSSWHRMVDVPRIPGVTLPGSLAFATERERAKLVAARADGEWPTLLPASFEERVLSESDLLEQRDVVLLGKHQAFRYQDVSLQGEPDPLTVFVVPDRGRVQLLSCVIPVGSAPRVQKQCEGIVASVSLPSSQHYSLVPQTSYVRAVDGAVKRLNRAREAGRKELAAAGTVAEQASEVRRVGEAYGREAQRLQKQTTDLLVTPVHRKIVAQMGRVQTAYANLAKAALLDQAASFDDAKQVVRLREAELKKLFLQLRFAGLSMQ